MLVTFPQDVFKPSRNKLQILSQFIFLPADILNLDESKTLLYAKKLERFFNSRSSKLNCLPNDKILDWSKSKGFADDKIIANQKLKFDMKRVEE